MSKRKTHPTERELEILSILWKNGPSNVRAVNEQMNQSFKTGYTTTLKFMQIMTEKGLLVRDNSSFKHIYRTAQPKESTQHQLISQMLEKVFAGSAEKLVLGALSAKKVSAQELERIKKLLDKMGGKK